MKTKMFLNSFIILSSLLNFVNSARVLAIIPTPGYSHQEYQRIIYKQLALNGHEVVAFNVMENREHVNNLKEIYLNYPEISSKVKLVDMLNSNSMTMNFYLTRLFVQSCEFIFKHEEMQKLLANELEHFDLVFLEWNVAPCYSILAKRFNCSLIGTRSLGLRLEGHDSIANPSNPSYIDIAYNNIHVGFIGRVKDFLFSLYWRLHYNYIVVPYAQTIVNKHFVNISENVNDLDKKVSIVLTNTNYIISGVRPVVPANIEVGFLHIGKSTELIPKNMESFLKSNKKGFILFSIGTLIKSTDLSEELLNTILKTFSELPYNVIMKFELDHIKELPDNVMITPWIPQEKILAHPNIKCFVTHGGYLSVQEAIHYKVPLLMIPLLFDQPYIANRAENVLGIGKQLRLYEIDNTKSKFKISLEDVISNERYKRNLEYISKLVNDQPAAALDKALWWIEYVLRNNGAPFIQSKAVHLNWIQYLSLDVVLFIIICLVVLVLLIKRIFRQKEVKIKLL